MFLPRLSSLLAFGLFVLVFGFVLWYVLSDADRPADPPAGVVTGDAVSLEAPQDDAAADAAARQPLPGLDESDEAALMQWAEVLDESANERLLSVMPTKHVVRKLTALLAATAKGEMPSRLREFLRLTPAFSPNMEGGKIFLGDNSYRRYDPWVGLLVSMSPEQLVPIYRHWSPLLERAYEELGESGETFHGALLRTLELLSKIPLQDKPPVLIHMYGNVYRYENERLEGRSALTKLLARSGPDNTRRVRTWASALRGALL